MEKGQVIGVHVNIVSDFNPPMSHGFIHKPRDFPPKPCKVIICQYDGSDLLPLNSNAECKCTALEHQLHHLKHKTSGSDLDLYKTIRHERPLTYLSYPLNAPLPLLYIHTKLTSVTPTTPGIHRPFCSAPASLALPIYRGQGLPVGGVGLSPFGFLGTKWTVQSVRTTFLEKPPSRCWMCRQELMRSSIVCKRPSSSRSSVWVCLLGVQSGCPDSL